MRILGKKHSVIRVMRKGKTLRREGKATYLSCKSIVLKERNDLQV